MSLTTHYIATSYADSRLPLPKCFLCEGREFQRLAQYHADGVTDWRVTKISLTATHFVESATFTGLIGDCSEWIQEYPAGDTFIIERLDGEEASASLYKVEFEFCHPYTFRQVGPYVAYLGSSMLEASVHFDCIVASIILFYRARHGGKRVPMAKVRLMDTAEDFLPMHVTLGETYYCNSEYVIYRDTRKGLDGAPIENGLLDLHANISSRVLRDLYKIDFRILSMPGGDVAFRGFARNLDTLRTDTRLRGLMRGHQCRAMDYWTDETDPNAVPVSPFWPHGHWKPIA